MNKLFPNNNNNNYITDCHNNSIRNYFKIYTTYFFHIYHSKLLTKHLKYAFVLQVTIKPFIKRHYTHAYKYKNNFIFRFCVRLCDKTFNLYTIRCYWLYNYFRQNAESKARYIYIVVLFLIILLVLRIIDQN